jgi:hypothetical protein
MRTSKSKYTIENILPLLRHYIKSRNEAIALGDTDNGGAIHSVERKLDALCQRLCYGSGLTSTSWKKAPGIEISEAAFQARERGEFDQIWVEHVLPQRAYALKIIDMVGAGATNDKLCDFIRRTYRLAILTKDETRRLNRMNRSRMTPDRIAEAGIVLHQSEEELALTA